MDRTYWLEEFYQAIRAMWQAMGVLGRLNARHAPPAARYAADGEVAAAMRRVETAMRELR